MRKLDRKRQLSRKSDLSKDDERELAELAEEVGNLDFTRSVRDPLYEPFVNAMTSLDEYRLLQKPILSPEEQRAQEGLAEHVLAEIVRGTDDIR
jgi:hypothetical protein